MNNIKYLLSLKHLSALNIIGSYLIREVTRRLRMLFIIVTYIMKGIIDRNNLYIGKNKEE